jgi:hypothetical protein
MRATTAFCRLFSGLLKIDSALTLISFPRRDDADGFFAIDSVLTVNMNDQKKSCRDGTDHMPSLFSLDNTILDQNYARRFISFQ